MPNIKLISILKSHCLLTQFYWFNFPHAWMRKETEMQCRASIIVGYVNYNQKPSCVVWASIKRNSDVLLESMVHQYEKHITVRTANANCIIALLLCIETVSVSFWFENNDEQLNHSFINCCSIFRRKKVAVTMRDSYYFFLCKFWSKFMRAPNIIHNIN